MPSNYTVSFEEGMSATATSTDETMFIRIEGRNPLTGRPLQSKSEMLSVIAKLSKNYKVWMPVPTDAEKIERLADDLKDQVSEIAKQKRDGGVTVEGLEIATDTDARSLLTGAKQGGKANRKMVGKNFRANVTKVQFDAIVDAVDAHIQAVFDRQYDLHEEIDAATDEATLKAIDITSGWDS